VLLVKIADLIRLQLNYQELGLHFKEASMSSTKQLTFNGLAFMAVFSYLLTLKCLKNSEFKSMSLKESASSVIS